MTKNEIQVGGIYRCRVSSNFVDVRVEDIKKDYKGRTVYTVRNLKTNRQLEFHSAAKFRRVVN